MKNYITFYADFLGDSKWTETGDILVPEGRQVVEVIYSMLSQHGFDCSSPKQHSFYGWAFEINNGRFQCVLQSIDPWLLICDVQLSLKDKLLRKKHSKEHKKVLDAINLVLQQDTRFNTINYFTYEEYKISEDGIR